MSKINKAFEYDYEDLLHKGDTICIPSFQNPEIIIKIINEKELVFKKINNPNLNLRVGSVYKYSQVLCEQIVYIVEVPYDSDNEFVLYMEEKDGERDWIFEEMKLSKFNDLTGMNIVQFEYDNFAEFDLFNEFTQVYNK